MLYRMPCKPFGLCAASRFLKRASPRADIQAIPGGFLLLGHVLPQSSDITDAHVIRPNAPVTPYRTDNFKHGRHPVVP